MPSRTQIVCLHEGKQGRSIDPVFITALIKALNPRWLRKEGSNLVRTVPCGGRKELISAMPGQLRSCLSRGADTTLMVWADLDDDMENGDELKKAFWDEAQSAGITEDEFKQAVFVFAKDRLENWIEFLLTGSTDESREGPRVKNNKQVAEAARTLADRCRGNQQGPQLPASLVWACENWRALVERMK
ncbi:MAG: hypothetical protein ACOCUY_03830 [Verrucomicrobiota bacterium]